MTELIWYPEFGVIVKVWLPPSATFTAPLGLMLPPLPAEAVMVYVVTGAALIVILSSLVLSRSVCGLDCEGIGSGRRRYSGDYAAI